MLLHNQELHLHLLLLPPLLLPLPLPLPQWTVCVGRLLHANAPFQPLLPPPHLP